MIVVQVKAGAWESVAVEELPALHGSTEDDVRSWLESIGVDTSEPVVWLTSHPTQVQIFDARRVTLARVAAAGLIRCHSWCQPIFFVDSSDVIAGLVMLAPLASFH